MKILIHAANLTGGGGLSVGRSSIIDWQQMGIELLVLASPALADLIPDVPAIVIPESPGSGFRAARFFRKKAREAEKHFQPDAVFTVFGPPLWKPKSPHLCGFANGLYFPPKPYRAYGEAGNWMDTLRHRLKRKLVFRSMARDANLVWVETETAQKRLQNWMPPGKEILVVPNEAAVPENVFNEALPDSPNRRQVLMIAAPYPHKNFALLRETARLLPGFRFKVTLPEDAFQRFFPNAAESPNIQNAGAITAGELPGIYAENGIVFCPSVAEIFSATWVEAMSFGRPLVCADIPEAREICADAALYFHPSQPHEAAERITQLQTDADLYRQQVENGYRRLAALKPEKPRSVVLLHALKILATSRK